MGIATKFEKAIKKIMNLEKYDQYEAALIFGSFARGGANQNSDIDTIIVTKADSKNTILHPYIYNIKLDLSYYSFNQLEEFSNSEAEKRSREPMIAQCIILFDKTGRLTKLVDKLNKVKPKEWTAEMEAEQRFLMYHANDKVERNLETDPTSSIFSMNVGVNDLLKAHYLINEKWWISSKKLLPDLKKWDPKMYRLVETFLNSNAIEKKYTNWKKIYKYIHKQIGGFKKLNETIPEEFNAHTDLLVS